MSLGVKKTTVSLETAEKLLDAAVRRAEAGGFKMAIAVVGCDGALTAFRRMDATQLLAVEIAINKAWTAAVYGLSTEAWGQFVDGDPGVAQIVHTPRLVTFGGGIPIVIDGEGAGGIGVSGGHYSEDSVVAAAALDAVGLSTS